MVIYEVTLDVDAAVAAEFDAWLAEHMAAMLALPGFQAAQLLPPEATPPPARPEAVRRVVRYTLASRADLDNYLREHAPRMRAEGVSRFGNRFSASRRLLDAEGNELPLETASDTPPVAAEPARVCLNCSARLSGEFCARCGQRNHTVAAPLGELLDELAGSHFGLDTRLIRSLIPLFIRPGFLSREYCAGRRERYIKPLRLYLFSSILFFLAAAWFAPPGGLPGSVLIGGKPVTALNTAERNQTQRSIEQALAELKKARAAGSATETKPTAQGPRPRTSGVAVNALPARPAAPSFRERLLAKLARVSQNPADFERQLLYHTLPRALFVFLPLVALILKLFYAGSGRYYMEHLIFTLHLHALFFIALLVLTLFAALARHFGWPAAVTTGGEELIRWYLYVYLLLALRAFYRQSWLKTAVKYCLLYITYWVLAGLTFAGAVAYTFLTSG